MTGEEIKNLLRTVRSKKSRLKALRAYIDEERALIEGVGAVEYDSRGVVSSVQNETEKRYVRHLSRLNQLEERFDILFDEMCAEEDRLCELMQGLSPTEYEVILNLYLRGLPRRKTARIMGYTEDGIKDIRKRFIKKMSKK